MHECAAARKEDGPVSAVEVWSVHLDGGRPARHVRLSGRCLRPGGRSNSGVRTIIDATLFNTAEPAKVAAFFDDVMAMGVDGISVPLAMPTSGRRTSSISSTAPKLQGVVPRHFQSARQRDVEKEVVVRPVIDVLGFPCRQPVPLHTLVWLAAPILCAFLGEGYAKSFKDLMETTDWDKYGTVTTKNAPTAWYTPATRPARCSGEHCAGAGPRWRRRSWHSYEGPMAPDIPLDKQRPAEYVFSRHVETASTGSVPQEAIQ